jgi:NADH-quinone oxidoreductase subunit I
MTIRELIKRALFIEILQGLALTLRTFLSRPVTVQYPKEKRPVSSGFRGRHAMVRDGLTGKERCVACMKCAMVCPSQCIYIKYSGGEGGPRVLEKYEIEALRCIYCGYCVEVCPVNALVLTEHYEYAGHSREEFLFDRDRLLKNWDDFLAQKGGYFNKFWRPTGIDPKRLPVGKR